jgi:hypothetical protein
MPPKKQKKQKKPLMKKTKLKSLEKGVNLQVNIDNSRKPIARRTPSKAANLQPFVNFPSHQPARIQQLEPKQQFNNADFTKTMDEYQKQFKTYLETKDKDTKDMIEKFDDTLKKNIAPPKKEESKPGASNVLADNEGTVILEQPITKGHTSWGRPNELKKNNMMNAEAEPYYTNQLFDNPPQVANPATIEEVVGSLNDNELQKTEQAVKEKKLDNNIIKKYNEYVQVWKQFYGNDNYETKMTNARNKPISVGGWSNKISPILKKLKQREANIAANELSMMGKEDTRYKIKRIENELSDLKESYKNATEEEKLIIKETRRLLKSELKELQTQL